jgi:CsoR family transcriptional regulator, copper-sensing transcriptional repressor
MGSASKLTDSRRRVCDLGWGEALMENVTKAGVIRRLQSIDGHVRGIQRMVEEDQYCIDVIKQIDAVEAALRKVQEIVLDSHLHTCVTTAIRGDDAERREAVIDEIMGVFSVSNK